MITDYFIPLAFLFSASHILYIVIVSWYLLVAITNVHILDISAVTFVSRIENLDINECLIKIFQPFIQTSFLMGLVFRKHFELLIGFILHMNSKRNTIVGAVVDYIKNAVILTFMGVAWAFNGHERTIYISIALFLICVKHRLDIYNINVFFDLTMFLNLLHYGMIEKDLLQCFKEFCYIFLCAKSHGFRLGPFYRLFIQLRSGWEIFDGNGEKNILWLYNLFVIFFSSVFINA